MVWVEAQVVSERINALEATRAVLLQMAISTIPNQATKPSAQKKAVREFQKLITKMTGS